MHAHSLHYLEEVNVSYDNSERPTQHTKKMFVFFNISETCPHQFLILFTYAVIVITKEEIYTTLGFLHG